MEALLGIAMIYSWIHSLVIVAKKTTGLTSYEKGVLLAGLVTFCLFVIGTLMG